MPIATEESSAPHDASVDPQAASRLRPAKRDAIVSGGRAVFARDGYARASVDAIAAASGVSTRTIYKHFTDKQALFAAVIVASAGEVAEAEITLIHRHLAGVVAAADVEPALRAFATDWLDDAGAWLAGMPDAVAHRALIGQVQAEAAHLGEEVVASWWRAGAGRVRAELAATLARWADAGLLSVPDAERAAVHLSRLASALPGAPAAQIPALEREAWIAAGVAAFVRAYRP